jgi:hypothetical protein
MEEEAIMSSSTLDPDNLPVDTDRKMPPGHAARSIGRSDSSDSGSDLIGDGNPDDDTSDRAGTGERLSADPSGDERPDADIGFDRIVTGPEAGLGGGLDQAEEAQLGITDEEIEELDELDDDD